MKEIKSINVLSLGLHMGIFFGFLNIVASLYMTLIYPLLVGQSVPSFGNILMAVGNNLVLGLLVGFLVIGLLGGLLYNIFAKILGGIKINLE